MSFFISLCHHPLMPARKEDVDIGKYIVVNII